MRKNKLTKKEMMFFLFPLGLLAAPFVLGVINPAPLLAYVDLRGDALDRAIRRRVGYAKDCGTVPLRGNRAMADACAVTASNAKIPFRVRYQEMGTDSERASAMAGNSAGEIYVYTFDGDSSGGGNVGAAVYEQ